MTQEKQPCSTALTLSSAATTSKGSPSLYGAMDDSTGPTETPTGRSPQVLPIHFQAQSRTHRRGSKITPCIVTVDLAEFEQRILADLHARIALPPHLLTS